VDLEVPWESVCDAETPWLRDVVSALDRVLEEKELREEEDDVIVWAGVTDHALDVTWWAGVVDSLWVVCAGVVDWPAVVCAPVTVLPYTLCSGVVDSPNVVWAGVVDWFAVV
jgi:hypothetical protein